MDERVRKKRSKVNRSKDFMDMQANDEKDLGHSLKVESDIEKKRKHKDKKKKCSTDEALNLNKVFEENSIGIAAKGRDCCGEGDAMRNGEENNENKRKKWKKGKDKDEIVSGIIDVDNEMHFLDHKQERKTKKRKIRNDSIPKMQEGFALESRSENNEGANSHSVVTDNDDQGKKIKKKKAKEKEKLTSKGKIREDNELRNNGSARASAESHGSDPYLTEMQERKTKKRKNRNDSILEMEEGFTLESRSENNEGANTHSVVTNNNDQGKKIKKKEKAKEKKLTSKGKIIDDNKLRNNGGDRASAGSHESNPHLTEINIEEGFTLESRSENNEGANTHSVVTNNNDQGKKIKKKEKAKEKKLTSKGKIIEDNKLRNNGGDRASAESHESNPHLTEINMEEGFTLESRSENNEGPNTHSVVTNNNDQGKKIKKKEKAKEKKKLTRKGEIIEDNKLRNNGGDRASAESHESNPHLTKINMGDAIEPTSSTKGDDQGKKKKMKKKSKEDKRVTFSDQVEVFNDGLVQGKRFTKEEDEKIKEAVYSYIDAHGLGDHDQGVDMVLHCSSYPKLKGCWKEIASALPHRPPESVYYRGHILFERDDSHKWTPEELEIIRNFHEKHGPNWKMLADAMGKHRFHVKDAWRRIKLGDVKKGHWSQDEYQKLFNLVNADLSMRALEETRKYKHGMLRDNICWEAIGNKVATRTSQLCCMKWYEKLTSPMVAEGKWADTDDYRLLNALYTLDACSMEEVEWDHLLEHRSGDVCRKRWNQMVQHIGEHGIKSFSEQVEILSERYRPDLVDAREAFDSKPVVP